MVSEVHLIDKFCPKCLSQLQQEIHSNEIEIMQAFLSCPYCLWVEIDSKGESNGE
jgi:hypothetical protein